MSAPRPAAARGDGGHTPKVVDAGDGFDICGPNDELIAWVPKSAGLALARKMAAAPLLFEALKLHVGRHGHAVGCLRNTLTTYPCSTRCQATQDALAAASPAPDADAGEGGS